MSIDLVLDLKLLALLNLYHLLSKVHTCYPFNLELCISIKDDVIFFNSKLDPVKHFYCVAITILDLVELLYILLSQFVKLLNLQ